jgi:hypothetical protein
MKENSLVKIEDKELQELVEKVWSAYKLTHVNGRSEKETFEIFEAYDRAVDNVVELTNGTYNAYKTDPMGSLDYKAITGKSFTSLNYNELCEALGSLAFGE